MPFNIYPETIDTIAVTTDHHEFNLEITTTDATSAATIKHRLMIALTNLGSDAEVTFDYARRTTEHFNNRDF